MSNTIEGYNYDIFISYRQKDNKGDRWVSEFVEALKTELESTIKEDVSVYFDENPDDRLGETHDVERSLHDKLKCLIFMPILSQTYCDTVSYAWQNEFGTFIETASHDRLGIDIRLKSGNVASRILPIRIHDLEPEDINLFEKKTGSTLRAMDFVFKTVSGVSRPLLPNEDHPTDNLNKTYYRDQINKVANAVKEIIAAIKSSYQRENEDMPVSLSEQAPVKKNHKTRNIIIGSVAIVLILLGLLILPRLFKPTGEQIKSIAVLPFFNDSPDEENEYFINGIMDEILNNLQEIKELSVVSRTSVEQYRGKDKPPIPEIARKLNVNYIVEGSGQKYGNNFRLRVQLIDGNKDKHLWAESYEREINETKDIFLIQTTIAEAIASELKTAITPKVRQQIEEAPAASLEAYDAYLKGLFFYERGGGAGEDNLLAIEAFKESIRLDSTFALPWTYLSMCYWRQANSINSPEFKEAKGTAEKALLLDPASGVALVNIAEVLDNEYDFAAAEEKIKLALRIEPDNQYVLRNAGRFYTKLNKSEESIANCKKALQKNPNNRTVLQYLCEAYLYAGRLDEAMDTFKKYQEIGYSGTQNYYKILLEQGQFDKIINEPEIGASEYLYDVARASAHFALRHTSHGQDIIDKLIEKNTPAYWIAFPYTYADNPARINYWLERSYIDRENDELTYIPVEPAFKKYHDLPAVKKIIREIKYPD
ncbi:MAG: tetratricopeptide repeat protein [Bacteroidales bacterium]|nr:tetratricopeptide repeat protein [Bacteroidales bacterium]